MRRNFNFKFFARFHGDKSVVITRGSLSLVFPFASPALSLTCAASRLPVTPLSNCSDTDRITRRASSSSGRSTTLHAGSLYRRNDKRTRGEGFARRAPVLFCGSPRAHGRGESQVIVGTRVSICFDSSYDTKPVLAVDRTRWMQKQMGGGGEEGETRPGVRWDERTIVLRYRSPWLFRKPYQSLSWLVAGGAQPSYRGLRFWTMRSLPASSRSPLTFVTGPNNGTYSHENGGPLNPSRGRPRKDVIRDRSIVHYTQEICSC